MSIALSSILSKLQQSLTAQEIPEAQFLNVDLYKNENFNLKTFSLSIFSKIQDTRYLLNQLNLTIERAKEEIVSQINSNFNNYVTLISKLQTIDFLIDNINSSLKEIKKKINSEVDLVSRYENEISEMDRFIKNNDIEIRKIKKMISKYENKMKCEKLIEKIDFFIKNNQTGLHEKNYTTIRKILFLFISFFSTKSKGIEVDTTQRNNLIDTSSEKFLKIIDDIFQFTFQKYLSQSQNKIQNELNMNILKLINEIYIKDNNQKKLYEKIYESTIKQEINQIIQIEIPISKIISGIINLMKQPQYERFIKEFNDTQFGRTCFLYPFITKFPEENKFPFGCSDANQFKENYNSFLDFLTLFDISKVKKDIINFIQRFSFFTYYQYIQNDITSNIIELMNDNNLLDLNKINNCLMNFMNAIREVSKNKKIFLKNLPNFLNFVVQSSNFLSQKIKEAEKVNKILFIQQKGDKKLFEEINEKEKEDLNEYHNIMSKLIEFFKEEGEFNSFVIETTEREAFFFTTQSEKERFMAELKNICIEISSFYLKN